MNQNPNPATNFHATRVQVAPVSAPTSATNTSPPAPPAPTPTSPANSNPPTTNQVPTTVPASPPPPANPNQAPPITTTSAPAPANQQTFAPQTIKPTTDYSGASYQAYGKKKFDIKIEPKEPEIRKDYLFDYFVLIAPKRHSRPFDHNMVANELIETDASPKLWLQNQVMAIKNNKGQWEVMTVDNKYPSLSLDQPKAYGKQEILIDTPRANVQLGQLDTHQIVVVLQGYAERISQLRKLKDIKYVLVFKNEGRSAGASLAHAHTQIFALPLIPNKFSFEASIIENYVATKKHSPYDKIIDFETRSQVRVIDDNPSFLTFCPYAPMWDLETWIMPKRPVRSITELNANELAIIARLFQQILGKLSDADVSYNFYLEEAVSQNHRFCIKIRGRDVVSPWGGFEVATGMKINTIPPEDTARWFKAI